MLNIRASISYSWLSYLGLFSLLSPMTYLVIKVLGPITAVLFFTLLGIATGGDPAYYIVGNSTQIVVVSGIFGMLTITVNERRMGTLPQLVMTPTNNAILYYGRSIFMIIDGLTSVFICFGVGALLFGLDFSQVNWFWLG